MPDFRAHEELVNNLETALDFSRVVSVFNTLLGILKEQQEKIEDSEAKIAQLTALVDKNHRVMKEAAAARPNDDDVNARIQSIEEKLDEIMQHVNGTKDADNSILHDAEVSPFMMFQNAGALFTKPEPIPIPAEQPFPPQKDKETPIATSRSARDKPFPIQEEHSFNTLEEMSVEGDTKEDQTTTTEPEEPPVQAKEEVVEAEEPPPVVEEEKVEEEVATVEEEVAPEERAPTPVVTEEPKEPEPVEEPPVSTSQDQEEIKVEVPEVIAPPKVSRPPSALKPSTENTADPLHLQSLPKTRVSFDASTNTSARLMMKDPSPLPSARPTSAALRPKTPEDSGPRFNVGKYANERLANTGDKRGAPGANNNNAASGFRRKMTLTNLPFLTTERLKKVVKELKTRGRFLIISKNIIENAKKKYAGESLKQRIDYLEADLLKLNNKYMKLQETVKKNNMTIKEMFPRNFQENWEKFDVFFGYIEKFGGITNIVDKLELLNKADESVFTPGFIDVVTNHVKKTALQEHGDRIENELIKYRQNMIDISGEMITKQDLNNMLKDGQTLDGNQSKLMNLIHKAIEAHTERLDLVQEEKKKKLSREVQIGPSTGPSSADLEKLELALQKYTNDRLQELNDEIDKMQRQNALKGSHMEEDILFVKEKIHGLELVRDLNAMEHEKMEQARKEEMEALMILQKRIANLSVDRVMDDLKALQKDVQERPNASQINEMIESIETTFKGHLGENVTGLKGLVHQVYRHIQHKVDRDDIKRLITSKLTQMEKEIVHREEEMMRLASSTRCMSCGLVPRPTSTRGGKRTARATSPSASGPHQLPTISTSIQSPTTSTQLMLDDELSVPENQQHANNASIVFENAADANITTSPYSSGHTEQVYALLTGQVGLKPIQLRHAPMNPVSHPSVIKGSNKVNGVTEKIPEPWYRKARMSAQIKEMVKVHAPALDSYGYGANSNPMYVYDGNVQSAEDAGMYAVPSSRQGARSRSGARVPSANLEYSNSLTSVGIQNQKSLFSQTDPNQIRKGGNNHSFTLPEISDRRQQIGYSSDNDSQHTFHG